MLVKLKNYGFTGTDFLAAQKIIQCRFNFYTHNELLESVLIEIERNLKGYISDFVLADKFSLSKGHLCRLFRLAFGRPLGAYIRSRKLSASIEDLLNTDMNIIDIGSEYGFDYEQSYIRAFKREFGITPGGLRKNGQIVKITPPFIQKNDQNCSSIPIAI
jgi:AraC-like DNA-binding protein